LNQTRLIRELNSSDLFAECSNCGKEFKLADAILFDGRGAFPEIAEDRRREMLEKLKLQMEELKKRKISADVGAEQKAIEVGIGKIIEKIVPAYMKFKIPLCDCRPLFEPIDFLVFNGMSKMKVDSVTFLEIKTGIAGLNRHERMVRDAINDKKLTYRVM